MNRIERPSGDHATFPPSPRAREIDDPRSVDVDDGHPGTPGEVVAEGDSLAGVDLLMASTTLA
jgi:hypothetical protein